MKVEFKKKLRYWAEHRDYFFDEDDLQEIDKFLKKQHEDLDNWKEEDFVSFVDYWISEHCANY